MLKKILSVFFITFLLGRTLVAQDFKLTLEFDKQVYLQGDMVRGLMTLYNISSQDIINYPMGFHGDKLLKIFVTTENGDTLKKHSYNEESILGWAQKNTLSKGEFDCQTTDISNNFGNTQYEPPALSGFYYGLLPGKYIVQIVFETSIIIKQSKDTLLTITKSNKAAFEIIEPTRPEDIETAKALREANGGDWQKMKTSNKPFEERSMKLKELIKKNMNSDYMVLAYFELLKYNNPEMDKT